MACSVKPLLRDIVIAGVLLLMIAPQATDPSRLSQHEKCVAGLIQALHAAHPDKKIIINRGFGVIDLLPAGTVDGVLIESLFQTYDHSSKSHAAVPASDTAALTTHIQRFHQSRLPVHVIDYVDPTKPDLALVQRFEGRIGLDFTL